MRVHHDAWPGDELQAAAGDLSVHLQFRHADHGLPEVEPDQALRTLVDLDRDKKLLSRDIVMVDLRLADRVTVRQSDAASAAREEAIKALDKTKKKKGSEA